MFEIKKPSASNRTIRMSDILIEKLEKLAGKNDISFNQLVIQCCEYAIEHLKQSDNNVNDIWIFYFSIVEYIIKLKEMFSDDFYWWTNIIY